MLKKIVLVLGSIFLILFIGALFLDKSLTLTEEIQVNKPIETVYSFVRKLPQWPQWTFWSQKRYPNMQFSCNDQNTSCTWLIPPANTGKLKLQKEIKNQKQVYEVLLGENFPFLLTFSFSKVHANKTNVQMQIYVETGYNIFMRYFLPMLKSKMQPDLQYTLNGLKNSSDSRQNAENRRN
ncbi:MAG: hypothetical protein D6767_01325 [Candidatus Hydrogenedentota bacterium]|nr:MAG: hypothetical protein D6767_01325 [Candidatus Hydrogenedentota bacterium]